MKQIAVIGAGECSHELSLAAKRAGSCIAGEGATLLCGGLSGVMEAACRGAKEKGGTTVGILPGLTGENPYVDTIIRTGLGQARNVVLVQSADAVIAIGGEYGTLSEIATALKTGRPVFGYRTWDIRGVISCESPEDAVFRAVHACDPSRGYHSRQENSLP
jgi:uncharacterized protein (TIGR00725 family)